MIRAVLRDGKIQPLGSLPEEWREGQELEVEAAEPAAEEGPPPTEAELEVWMKECDEAAARITPEEHERFMKAIAEHEEEQKELMRKRWGLHE